MQLSLTLFVALQTQQGFFLGFGEVGVLISKPVWEDEEVDSMQSMINKVFNNYNYGVWELLFKILNKFK